jgi:hypothetical protein
MRTTRLLLLAVLTTTSSLADVAEACDRTWPVRYGMPRRAFARAAGVVTGYSVSPPALGTLAGAPVMLLRVDEVVSGGIARGETQVIVQTAGRGCRSTLSGRDELERGYPIGTAVVVLGQARRAPPTAAGVLIVVEEQRGQYVQRVPPYVVRTGAGDLDFARVDASQPGMWGFIEFEFDRAALSLGRSRPQERIARVENLAAYPGFARSPDPRAIYRQLVIASGASPLERRRLLEAFDERRSGQSKRSR